MRQTKPYYKIRYRDISVNYTPELDGGGSTFGQQYLEILRDRIGPVEHVFEYCAGPGFIGFSLLANGLCQKLTLADVNPAAVEAARQTVRDNYLGDRVAVYESDCLDQIPATEKWDLVVSNPPHWPGSEAEYKSNLRLIDPDFIVHKKFYRDIGRFLKPNGSVVFQENGHATTDDQFHTMIRENGLRIVETIPGPKSVLSRVTLPGALSQVPQRVFHKLLGPVERLIMKPGVEKLIKDNDVYRRLAQLPIFTPSPFYFTWSKMA